MYGELVPLGGGDTIPLLKQKLIIGRRQNCDISLQFPNISSHHCELELQNGYWHVRDLGSTNGIKVNGDRCDERYLLPNDELSVAKHRYEIRYEPSGEAPAPAEADPFEQSLLQKAGLDGERRKKRRRAEDSQLGLAPPASKSAARPQPPTTGDEEPVPLTDRETKPAVDAFEDQQTLLDFKDVSDDDEDSQIMNWLLDPNG